MERISIVQFLTIAALAAVVQGCAAIAPFASTLTGSAPTASHEIHTQTSVKLQEGNFVTIRTNVVGQSKGFKLLGFITLVPATLNEAMNQLYTRAEAQHGRPQTLAHLTVEHSGIYVILFSIPKVTARADLIEFIPKEHDEETGPESADAHRGDVQRASGSR